MAPLLKSYCFCLTLEQGSWIVAWTGTLLSIANLLYKMQYPAVANSVPAVMYFILVDVIFMLEFAVHISLIIALQTKNRDLMAPFLATQILSVIWLSSLIPFRFISTEWARVCVLGVFAVYAFALYQWLCVQSYYQQIKPKITKRHGV